MSGDGLAMLVPAFNAAAFLPRPLYFVPALPRDTLGKLPREAITRLLANCGHPGMGRN